MAANLPTISIPLRWADIDVLNHVNNVLFLDYAMEAQRRLVADGELAAQTLRFPVGVNLEYHRPLLLAAGRVDVSNDVGAGELIQQIKDGTDVFATVTTCRADTCAPQPTGAAVHHVTPRFSDTGAGNAVSTVKIFEYMQEARIAYATSIAPQWAAGGFVVANVRMTCYVPVARRSTSYEVRAAISRVGNSSFTVDTHLVDDRNGNRPAVLACASSVLVGFDMDSQTSRPFTDTERTVLTDAAGAARQASSV